MIKIQQILTSVILFSALLHGGSITEVEIGGTTYGIKEINIVELIQKHIEDNKDMIQEKLDKVKIEMKKKIENYKPRDLTKNILPATKDAIRYPDPSYTTQFDVKDNNGKILYPKGYKFNPLQYVTLTDKYVVFDYTRQEQIDWIIKNNLHRDITVRLILVDGKVFDAMKFFKREVFYSNDIILQRFDVKVTPSVIVQEGDRIKIQEFYLSQNVEIKMKEIQ
jgi:conjugal transfer pilus assembly protein TraW